MKKLTYDFVKQYFEDNGCKLLTTEYVTTNTRMPYLCSCWNESVISFSNFKSGKRCKNVQVLPNLLLKKSNNTLKIMDVSY